MKKLILEKIKESVQSILPLTLVIVIVLFIFKSSVDSITNETILSFIGGALMLMIGLVIFNIGAESSVIEIAREIGGYIVKKRNVFYFIAIAGLMGFLITFSEPSVTVLGKQFQSAIPLNIMVPVIALASGLFLIVSLFRVVLKVPLNIITIIIYGTLFIVAFLIPKEFIPVAFDAGGFSTGPMAVPFLMALGFGVVSNITDSKTEDGFGVLGITSIGPIFAVLILGLFYKPQYSQAIVGDITFGSILLDNLRSTAISILPFLFFFIIFQFAVFKYNKKKVIKVLLGFFLTYIGLAIFLTGAAVGFMDIGIQLGKAIAQMDNRWLLVIFGLLFGLVIVLAEPSVVVLIDQVQEATDGTVSRKVMAPALSIGVSVMIGLALMRIVLDINILWFIVPGYLIILVLSFFVPKMFTGIALDSGGAVSGVLAATFLIPFALGAASAIYPNEAAKILLNGFGVMAFIVMAPLLTIQILGLIYKYKTKIKPTKKSIDEVIKMEE